MAGASQRDILTCFTEVPAHGLVFFGGSGKIVCHNDRDGQVRQIEGVQKLDIIYSVVASHQGLVMAAGKNGLMYYFRYNETKASKLMVI